MVVRVSILQIEKVSDCLKSLPVMFAYLFGSQASGNTKPDSDLDVALMFDRSVNQTSANKLRLDVMQKIARIVHNDRVDIIPLHKAPLLLRYKIIKNKQILVDREPLTRVMFEHRVLSDYFDRKYYIDRHARFALEQIAERGIS